MKKLGLFLAIITLSFSSFANKLDTAVEESALVEGLCPQQPTLEKKAECLKNVARKNDDEKIREKALQELKLFLNDNKDLKDKMFKHWMTNVVEAIRTNPTATEDALNFYMGKLNAPASYLYEGNELPKQPGDTLIHVATREVQLINCETNRDDFEDSSKVLVTLINYADVCVENSAKERSSTIFKGKTYPAGGLSVEYDGSINIRKAFAAKEKKSNNCTNSIVRK